MEPTGRELMEQLLTLIRTKNDREASIKEIIASLQKLGYSPEQCIVGANRLVKIAYGDKP